MKRYLFLVSMLLILFLTACKKDQPSLELSKDQDWDTLPLQEFKLPTSYLFEDDRPGDIKQLNDTTYVLTRNIGGGETQMKIIQGKKILSEQTLTNFFPIQVRIESPYFYFQAMDETNNQRYLGIIDQEGNITKTGSYEDTIRQLPYNYQDLVIALEPTDSPNTVFQIIDPMTNELILEYEKPLAYTFQTVYERTLYFDNIVKTRATKTSPEKITTHINIVSPDKVQPLTFENEVSYVRFSDSIGMIQDIDNFAQIKQIHTYKNNQLTSSDSLKFLKAIDLERENAIYLIDSNKLMKLNRGLEVIAEQDLDLPVNPNDFYTYPNHLFYITDTENQRLMKYDYNLNLAGEIPMGPNAHRLIHVDKENNVYVQVKNAQSETGMTTHVYDANSKYRYSVEAELAIDIATGLTRFRKIQNENATIYNLKEERLLTTNKTLPDYVLNESILYAITPIDPNDEVSYQMTIVNYEDGKVIKELEIGTSSIDRIEEYGDYIIFTENNPYSYTQKLYVINKKNGDVMEGQTIRITAFNKIEPVTTYHYSFSNIIYFKMNGKVYYYKDVDINNPGQFING